MILVGLLLAGGVLGMWLYPRVASGVDPRVEKYILYASQLHAQGESPLILRDRLMAVGISQPATTVMDMAKRYAASSDRKQHPSAEGLDVFGKALLNPAPPVAPTATAVAAPQSAPESTGIAAPPAATPTAIVLNQPERGVPTATQAVRPPTATRSATTGAPPLTYPATGVVQPGDNTSVRLRDATSTTTGKTIDLFPSGTPVEILESIQGQSIENETRWFRVRVRATDGRFFTGFMPSKYVAVGGR